jgi:hypothetical protein
MINFMITWHLKNVEHVDDLVDSMVDDWATDVDVDQCLVNNIQEVTKVVCGKNVVSKIDMNHVPIQISDFNVSHKEDIHAQGEKQSSVPAMQASAPHLQIEHDGDNKEKCVRRRR